MTSRRRARHHHPTDYNGDGDAAIADLFAYLSEYSPHLSPVVDPGRISWEDGPDNTIGYCGYVFNPETDDYTVRFRHYDPEIARWLERDPLEVTDSSNLLLTHTGDSMASGQVTKAARHGQN